MARLPYLEKTDLALEDQDLLARPITLFKCMTHSPKAARAFHGLGHFIRYDSHLDPRLRELAILTVGWVTRSPYEWSHHVKISHDFGVTDNDIRGLIAELDGKPNALDPFAKLVLKAAREITTTIGISDATFASLKEKLDNERLTDLVLTISFYSAVVRYLGTMQIDVEADYQPYLDKFPLPNA